MKNPNSQKSEQKKQKVKENLETARLRNRIRSSRYRKIL